MSIMVPEVVLIPITAIMPNEWNPNVMGSDLFNELAKNIQEFGFVQPIVVSPIPEEEQADGHEYKIVDGEHRFDCLRLLDVLEVPCIIKVLTQDEMKFQTVKMNRLRGRFDQKKFNALITGLLKDYSFEEVAAKMAFTDPTELELLIGQSRENLPSDEMKSEFDKAKGEIRTVDDLADVLNRLFSKYGDTLPYNFMVLDFGSRQHIWVRLDKADYHRIVSQARECITYGVTFDSVLARLISEVPLGKFIDQRRDFLKEVSDEDISRGRIRSGEEEDIES